MNIVVATVDGERFCGTFEVEAAARKQAEVYNLQVRAYGIDLRSVDPKTNAATVWHETEGWSTWDVSMSHAFQPAFGDLEPYR